MLLQNFWANRRKYIHVIPIQQYKLLKNVWHVLDGAERAVATSSGMAAVHAMCMAYLKAGDHVICSRAVLVQSLPYLKSTLLNLVAEVTFCRFG